jgi:hypothetical protein
MGVEVFGNKIINISKAIFFELAQPELKKIQRFKDIHRGESCYLMGDGMSLKWFDLKNFSNKVSIGSGSLIPFHKEFKLLNMRYLMLLEPFWFFPAFWTDNFTKSTSMPCISKAYGEIIKNNQDKQFFLNLSNYAVLRSNNLTYMFRAIKDKRLASDFITNRINAFQGSLRASILLAIYMGYDHCYLVGCDYTHVPSRSLHWYEKGQGIFFAHENYNKDFFEIAKEFIDITTITLDGTSEFINSVTYKEHTGQDPVFRENTELIAERYLNVLATWSGYKIF